MNKYEVKSINTFNRKANNYDDTFDGKFTVKFKQIMIDKVNFNPNDTVLDIACGNGSLLREFSKKHKIISYGIDISDKMIENARKNNLDSNIKFEVSKCDDTSFENNMFDVITVCASFHHFPDVKAFAKEVNRILRKGGSIYIAEVYIPLFFSKVVNPFVKFSKLGDVKFYTRNEIIDSFTDHNFEEMLFSINGNVQILCLKKTDD